MERGGAAVFVRQTELIMEAAVESAVSELHRDTDSPERRAQLTAVLRLMTREAVRKIHSVFRELYVSLVTENEALKDKVGHLESGLRSKVEKTQTVYKVKPSDGPALSLDISQPAAGPAALAMAILNSAKSRRSAGSAPLVPLVIISQPLPGPITGKSSPAPPVPPEKPDQTTDNATADLLTDLQTDLHIDLQTEEGLEVNQIFRDPDESFGDVTSLPVANDQPSSEDMPSPEDEHALPVVSVCFGLNWLLSTQRSSISTPSPSRRTELLTLSLRETPATLLRKPISAASTRDRRLTGRSSSLGPDPVLMTRGESRNGD